MYELTLTGKSKESGLPSFQVSYAIRVDHSAAAKVSKNSDGILVLLAGSGSVLGFVFLTAWQIRKGGRYEPKVKTAANRKK